MNINIFTSEFTNKVLDTLNTECPKDSGQRITRANLAEKLEMEKAYEPVLGILINDHDDFQEWDNFKGVGGGIGRIGEAPPKKSNGSSGPVVPAEFLAELSTTLERICTSDADPMPRRVIAAEMGQEGGREEAMISAALKMDEFKEKYDVKRGKSGGVILRVDTVEEDGQEQPEDNQDIDTIDLDIDEVDENYENDVADELATAFEDEDEDYSAAV